jgi:RNA polymerase sigma-70 factor, ECF subfamily
MTATFVGQARPTSALSDGELVQAHLAGDATAWEEVVARFNHRLLARMWQWCHTPQDAEDLTQDVWAAALRALQRFDTSAPLWPWLATIGDNAAKSRLRRSHPGGVPRESVVEPARMASSGITEDPSIHVDDMAFIRACWRQLSSADQHVLHLVEVQDLPLERAATLLQMTPAALRQRLCRARARLREVGRSVASLPAFQWLIRCPAQVASELSGSAAIAGVPGVVAAVAAAVALSGGAGSMRAESHVAVPAEPFQAVAAPIPAPPGAPVAASTPVLGSPSADAGGEDSTSAGPQVPETEAVEGRMTVPSVAPEQERSSTPVPGTDRTFTTGQPHDSPDYAYGVGIVRDEDGNPALETSGDDPATAALDEAACTVAEQSPATYCTRTP